MITSAADSLTSPSTSIFVTVRADCWATAPAKEIIIKQKEAKDAVSREFIFENVPGINERADEAAEFSVTRMVVPSWWFSLYL